MAEIDNKNQLRPIACQLHNDMIDQVRSKVPWIFFAILLPVFAALTGAIFSFLYTDIRRLEERSVFSNTTQLTELSKRISITEAQFGILAERMNGTKELLSTLNQRFEIMNSVVSGLNDRIDARIDSLDKLNITIDKYLKMQQQDRRIESKLDDWAPKSEPGKRP